jgi:cell division protein FtsB
VARARCRLSCQRRRRRRRRIFFFLVLLLLFFLLYVLYFGVVSCRVKEALNNLIVKRHLICDWVSRRSARI